MKNNFKTCTIFTRVSTIQPIINSQKCQEMILLLNLRRTKIKTVLEKYRRLCACAFCFYIVRRIIVKEIGLNVTFMKEISP